MTKSGNEELGDVARQSSNCSAGVPIKKRRFPLVRPPSPPAEELSRVPAERNSQPNLTQEPSPNKTIVATKSPDLFDVKNNSFPEEKKTSALDASGSSIQENVKPSRVKVEEASLSIFSSSKTNESTKPYLPMVESVSFDNLKTTQLLSDPSVGFLGIRGKEKLGKQKDVGDCKLELPGIVGNIDPSLELKEPYGPTLTGRNSEESCQLPYMQCPPPLSLSLSNERTFHRRRSGDISSNHHNTRLHANRSNWDLNTTMDTWEGTVSDAMEGKGALGLNETSESSGAKDVKPFIHSTIPVGASVNSGKQICRDGEEKSKFALSLNSDQPYKSSDSLLLRLSTSPPLSYFGGESSSVSVKVDAVRSLSNSNLVGLTTSPGEMVPKSELLDRNIKHDFVRDKGTSLGPSDLRNVKSEAVEKYGIEAVKMSAISTQRSVEHRSVKSEPAEEVNQEMHQTKEGTLSFCSDEKSSDNRSSEVAPSNLKKFCPPLLSSGSAELSVSPGLSRHCENSSCTKEVDYATYECEEASGNVGQVSDPADIPGKFEGKMSNASDDVTGATKAERSVEDYEMCKLKPMDELSLDSRGNVEGSVSDDEKINISAALEEESYGSDCESDDYHALGIPMDREDMYGREDDDYEDGEVREPVHTTASAGEKELENVHSGDFDDKAVHSFGLPGGSDIAQSPSIGTVGKIEDYDKASDEHVKECVSSVFSEKTDLSLDRDGAFHESPTLKVVVSEVDVRGPMNVTKRKLLDRSGREELQKGHEAEASSDVPIDRSQGVSVTGGQVVDAVIEKVDSLSKTDASLDSANAAKDASSGGTRSRIINLPRASNVSSPCKTRSIPGKLFPRNERERFTDYGGDKFHSRGNSFRDDNYMDGPRKFQRERFQDQTFRNPRLNFMRGRGRASYRSDNFHGERKPDRDFTSEIYNGPSDYRFQRRRPPPDVDDEDLKCNGYIYMSDGAIGTGRGGRKHLNDELPSFRHTSSRRQSPRNRNGSTTRGIQMVRRLSRNNSPSRCIGEDDSEFRHGEKFIRGLPDDAIEPAFMSHSRPPYEGVDGEFVRGNRKFSSFHRRDHSQIRSKSPMRSRIRSPGPWSSPRRRSLDRFDGLPELNNRRSPAGFRTERMRSPDRSCFPEEVVGRRRGSSPYMPRFPNDTRDMDSGRDHSHQRQIPNRSPSGRILTRGTRRFDMLDRERTNSDEYFGEGSRPGRFHELGDGSGDERRKFGERRGPIRSFRPLYNDADGGNFCSHGEEAPRPLRFCPDGDTEFLERGNLRDREFERRGKNRMINGPGRTRSMKEQEGNYRHGGQAWHEDDRFVEIGQMKRRRL